MNVTDESTETPSYNSQPASTIRIAPQFANRLCSRLETAEAMPDGISGLLFGTSQEDVVTVHAFRSLADSEITAIDAGKLTLENAVRELAVNAQRDPGLVGLDRTGWFAFRTVGGLNDSDIAFHNSQFSSPADIALIVRRAEGQLLFEFYARTERGPLTEKQHRWGASRFSATQALLGPVEIAMRARAKKAARAEGKALAVREEAPAPRRTNPYSIFGPAEEPASAPSPRSKPKGRLVTAGELPSLPAVIAQPKRSGVPWLSSAILFLIFAGGTFAFLLARGIPSANSNSFWRALLPDTGLNLRVEGQGDRVLLSWNRRNSVVRSAAGATLHIDDGAQHRDVRLDAAQVENGAVLYRPNSDDVSFRLDVRGQDGSSIAENLRVLDSTHANAQPVDLAAADAPSSQTTVNAPVTTQRVHVWEPAPATSQVAVSQPVQPTPSLDEPRPSPQRFDLSRLSAPAIPNANSPAAAVPPASSPNSTSSAPPQPMAGEPGAQPRDSNASQPQASAGQSAAAPEQSSPQNAEIRQTGVSSQSPPATPAAIKPTTGTTTAEPGATKPAPAQSGPAGQAAFASRYVPPRPIRQVLPEISALPPSVIASPGQVNVIVTVDKTGHVVKAAIQQQARGKPNRSLAIAAEYAARQWIFEPARLDGRPVPSEHSIIFQFGGR